jgi:hypothetical protein
VGVIEDHANGTFSSSGEYLLGRGIGAILSHNGLSDEPGTVQQLETTDLILVSRMWPETSRAPNHSHL